MRRSFRILEACERFRARRNPGTAMAASRAIIATTIMISTRVKPARRDVRLNFIGFGIYSSDRATISIADILPARTDIDFFLAGQKNCNPVTLNEMELIPDDYEALANFRYAMRKFLSFSKRALAAEADL